ncbi:MAG TPA: response regulator, partial [Roseiflexaceae bacterium]|nr:response regulator [Roseiflexaceae bacterium]
MPIPHYSILIVDDNPIDCAVFDRYLKQDRSRTYATAMAHSAAEGLAFCREQRPDAVLVDYGLPDDDGIEFLEALLAEHGSHAFAVVMLTGAGDEAIAVKAMQLGAQDYLVKGPQLETRLSIALASAIEKVALQQQVDQQRRELQSSNQQLQQALAAHQASEQQLLLAIQAARMATWEWNLATQQVSWSTGLIDLLGFPADARDGTLELFLDVIYQADQDYVRQQLEFAVRTGTLPSTEFRMHASGYKLHWLAAHGYVERDANGQPLRLIGIAMDINERKQAEEELRRRETSFKTLVENAPDIISRFDRNLRHLYVSPMIEQVTGMSAEAFIGKSNRELGMPEELCLEWEGRLREVFDSGSSQVIEFEFVMQTGETRRFQSTLVPEFSVNGKIETVLSI